MYGSTDPLNLHEAAAHFFTEMGNKLIHTIFINVFNFFDTSCEQETTANDTRIMSDIGTTAFTANTAARTICDSILFGMHCGLFMSITDNTDMI